MTDPRIITADTLVEALINTGFSETNILVADSQYSMPTARWVETFAKDWQTMLHNLRFTYIEERGDCDDFAAMARSYARLLHYHTPNAPLSGLAFGELWYASPRGGHAINLLAVGTDAGMKIRFFEPQPPIAFSELTLSEEEITSAWKIEL